MSRNIWIGIVVLVAGGWWYLNQSAAPATSTTEAPSAQVPNSNSQQPSTESSNAISGWSTYTNSQYKFQIQHPADYRISENPDGVAIISVVTPHSDSPDGVTIAKAYVRDNEFSSFAAYKADMKQNLIRNLFRLNNSSASDAEIDAQVVQQAGHYSFQEETIGGAPVLFHKRDFLGMIGGIYEMHIGISGNKILVFSSEAGEEFLDKLYHSFRILN